MIGRLVLENGTEANVFFRANGGHGMAIFEAVKTKETKKEKKARIEKAVNKMCRKAGL